MLLSAATLWNILAGLLLTALIVLPWPLTLFLIGYFIEATPEGYRQKGRFSIPSTAKGPSWPHPVICDGKLYLRHNDELLCYDIKA